VSLLFGLAVVWHVWWLVALSFVGIVVTLIVALTNDEPDEKHTAAHIASMAKKEALV